MTPFGRRALVLLAGIAFAFAIVAPAVARTRVQGSSSDGVTLVTPAGWFASDDGNVVAEVEADLDADVPTGPRAQIVSVKHPKKTKVKKIVKAIDAAAEAEPELLGGPESSTFGAAAVPGTVITFTVTLDGTRLVQRYVTLSLPGGNAATILLEAPEDQFDAAEESLMSAFNVN